MIGPAHSHFHPPNKLSPSSFQPPSLSSQPALQSGCFLHFFVLWFLLSDRFCHLPSWALFHHRVCHNVSFRLGLVISMCVYVRVCYRTCPSACTCAYVLWVGTHVRVCTCTRACVFVLVHMCCVCLRACVCVRVCVSVHERVPCVFLRVRVRVCVCVHARVSRCVRVFPSSL